MFNTLFIGLKSAIRLHKETLLGNKLDVIIMKNVKQLE